jgi:hypothetical protein
MSGSDQEMLRIVRRNKLLGMWAAEKLGLAGEAAKAYSDDLAMGTLDPERSDVLGKVRKDLAAAGVVQSDEQILRVMTQSWLEAGNHDQSAPADATDAALVQIARNFQAR